MTLFGNVTGINHSISFTTADSSTGDTGGDDSGDPGDNGSDDSPGGGTGESVVQDIVVSGKINENEEDFISVPDEWNPEVGPLDIRLDSEHISNKLAAEGSNATVSISLGSNCDAKLSGLTGQTVKSMDQLGASVRFDTQLADINIPASLIKIDEVAGRLGAQDKLDEIQVTMTIVSPDEEMVEVAEDTTREGGLAIVVPPVESMLECTYEGQSYQIDSFEARPG